eukprot:1148161-Pelagomonas_calceolata.AAC.11
MTLLSQQLLNNRTTPEPKIKSVDTVSALPPTSAGSSNVSPVALGGRPFWCRKRAAVVNESAKASEIDLVPKEPHTKTTIGCPEQEERVQFTLVLAYLHAKNMQAPAPEHTFAGSRTK